MQAARGASLTPSDQGTKGSSSRTRLRVLLGVLAGTVYAIDLVTKEWAIRALSDGDVPVVGDWFVLHLTFNPGAAFSLGTRFTIILTFLAIAAVVVVLWLSRRVGSRTWAVALGVLLGGVAGNLTDRLFRDPEPLRGHVVDFLMLPNWPVFNIADVCINVAAGLIILQTLRGVAVDGSRESDA